MDGERRTPAGGYRILITVRRRTVDPFWEECCGRVFFMRAMDNVVR